MPPRKTPAPGRGRAAEALARPYPGPPAPPGEPRADAEVAGLQRAVEGAVVPDEGKVEFLGRTFRVAEDVGLMPLLKFAHAADGGLGSEDLAGMSAMYAMIRDCIHPGSPCTCGAPVPDGQTIREALHRSGCGYDPGDWAEFERHAIDQRADGDELFELVGDVIEMVTARPTKRRSGSSRAARSGSPRSKGSSPAQAAGLVPVGDLLR